jgi:hypothetical protein
LRIFQMERNRIIALVILFGLYISVMIFAVFLIFENNNEENRQKAIHVTDSLKNLKADYDKNCRLLHCLL